MGTVSKALLMSMAVSMDLCDGDWLKPLIMCCVREVRAVVVEWFPLNPCWNSGRVMCGDIFFNISFSSSLLMVERREIGR